MTKTLGQVAFEAHMLSEDSFILPNEWSAHDADEQKHWQAAAEAVKAELRNETLQLAATHFEAESAVVEAARALTEYDRYSGDKKTRELFECAFDEVFDTVEALEKAEGK